MRHLLLIEDDREQAALLMRKFRVEGFSTAHARTLMEGLTRDGNEHFDCTILDLGGVQEATHTSYDTVNYIPSFRSPVVAYSGCGDDELIAAVRTTGAAFVEKPGVELLVEKIWSQINYRAADHESTKGQQRAQRALRKAPWYESAKAVVTIVISLLAATGGFASWAFHTIAEKVEGKANTEHRFDLLEARVKERERVSDELVVNVREIRTQNQISIDERKQLREMQMEFKSDIKDRLDRIERKLDGKSIALPLAKDP